MALKRKATPCSKLEMFAVTKICCLSVFKEITEQSLGRVLPTGYFALNCQIPHILLSCRELVLSDHLPVQFPSGWLQVALLMHILCGDLPFAQLGQ